MKLELEYREAIGTGQLKDVDEGRREVQVIFPHDTVDKFKTVFLPETFKRGFEEAPPIMAWMHDLRDPIGRAISAQSLREGNEVIGAFSDFRSLDEAPGICPVPHALQAYSQLKDGTVTDFSFGFMRNGPVVPWRNQRGVRAFTSAHMYEFSPVAVGAIPGAKMLSLRDGIQTEEDLEVPDIETLLKLRDSNHISELEFRKMLALTLPENYREHIDLTMAPAATPPAGGDPAGQTRAAGNVVGPDDGHKVEGIALLAQATDAALDRAIQLFGAVDTTDLDPNIRQAIDLVHAAGVSIDELLEQGGIDDPDDSGDGYDDDDDKRTAQIQAAGDGIDPDTVEIRSTMTTEDRNALSDDDFGYIEPGAKKGVSKTPEHGYHFPIGDAAHVRNALARIAQGAEFGDKAKGKVEARARKMGIDVGERAIEAYVTALVKLETREAELADIEKRQAEAEAIFNRRKVPARV